MSVAAYRHGRLTEIDVSCIHSIRCVRSPYPALGPSGRRDLPVVGIDERRTRIATYKVTTGSVQELADMAQKGMLRTFQDQPGFKKYGLADLGENTCLSFSLWETRKDAEAAVPVAANWVRENIADRIELRSNEIGELAFFEGAPARV